MIVIKMFAAILTLLLGMPAVVAGFIWETWTEGYKIGKGLPEKLSDWITKD